MAKARDVSPAEARGQIDPQPRREGSLVPECRSFLSDVPITEQLAGDGNDVVEAGPDQTEAHRILPRTQWVPRRRVAHT